jgi:N-acetylglucosamine-6-phosphate deacetylase
MNKGEVIKGIRNCSLVLPTKLTRGSLAINGDSFSRSSGNEEGFLTLPDNLFVAPGFIDEHIHGANGSDTMDAKISSLTNMAEKLPEEGVTSFNATTMTMDKDSILKALHTIKEYRIEKHDGARIIGAHLEGPFISPKHVGAQDPMFLIKPSVEVFNEFYKASGECVKEVTFAYEEDGGEALLSRLVELKITPSIGHSDCLSAKFKEGISHGLRCITHFYNAQRGLHHREPGIVGEGLINDGVKCELIADTIHVVPDAMKVLFRCKKKEDIVLISDSTEGKYLAPGNYELGGNKVIITDVARLPNGTIAGSILKINKALSNVSKIAEGYSFNELINLATKNPAENLGMYSSIGSLEDGKKADFVVLDKDFNVYLTVVGGVVAFSKL